MLANKLGSVYDDAAIECFAIERRIACEIYKRIELDIGKAMLEKVPKDDMRSYIEEKVAAFFRLLYQNGKSLTCEDSRCLISGVMQDTFAVFKEYIQ